MFIELVRHPFYLSDDSPDEKVCVNIDKIDTIYQDINNPEFFFIVINRDTYRFKGDYEEIKVLLQSVGESII